MHSIIHRARGGNPKYVLGFWLLIGIFWIGFVYMLVHN